MKHKNIPGTGKQKPSSSAPASRTTSAEHSCQANGHAQARLTDLAKLAARPQALDRAARLFFALGDEARLRLLVLLESGERCVGELVEVLGEKFPTVSQRLRLLRAEGHVIRRRDGNHLHYALADGHVASMLRNAIDHAAELANGPIAPVDDDKGTGALDG